MTNQQLAKILSILKRTYPKAKIALKYSNNWELLVSVILSAQCTDKKVNEVTSRLFAKYKTLQDYVNADQNRFEQDIKSTGFYHAKGKNILTTAKFVQEKFNGVVPRTMEQMLTLAGVARKTANVVLGNAYNVVEGIAVDTHVNRISQRLRLVNLKKIGGKLAILDYIRDSDPNKVEQELMKVIPKDEWFQFTYLTIEHGRAICKAQNPNCTICPLNKLCPASRI